MQRLWTVFVLPWLLALCACSSGGTPASEPKLPEGSNGEAASEAEAVRVELSPPGHPTMSVEVEIARTPEERQRGLMFRKHLPADAGMLFLFDAPQQLTFWMRNTYVPLDMIFIEDSMRVLGVVENAEPLTETSRFVPGPSQYVLEVNAGVSRANGIGPGTAVRFIGVDGVPTQGAP